MARILEGYRLRYRLSDRALAYVREVPAAGLSPEWRHGRQSRPFLEVWVLPDRVVLEVTHLYASGHMERYTAGGVLASAPRPDGLETWLDADARARVDRVRRGGRSAHPARPERRARAGTSSAGGASTRAGEVRPTSTRGEASGHPLGYE